MSFRQRTQSIKKDSKLEIEHMLMLASNNKGEIMSRRDFLTRKALKLDTRVFNLRESLRRYLTKLNIDDNFPILVDILSDDVKPDTVPQNLMTSFSVPDARSRNFPDQTVLALKNLLQEKYAPYMKDIDTYMDELMKCRLEKARTEKELKDLQNIESEYSKTAAKNQDRVTELTKLSDSNKQLQSTMYDLLFLIASIPGELTSQKNTTEFQASIPSNSPKWNSTRMRAILICADLKELLEDFETGPVKGVKERLQAIYDSLVKPESSGDVPVEYVKAVSSQTYTKANLQAYIDIIKIMNSAIEQELDIARGTPQPMTQLSPGALTALSLVNAQVITPQSTVEALKPNPALEEVVKKSVPITTAVAQKTKFKPPVFNNAVVDALVSQALNILESTANDTNADKDTLKTNSEKVQNDMTTAVKSAVTLKTNLTQAMKGGVDKLNEMMQNSKFSQTLDRMLQGIGLPVLFTADGNKNAKEGLREFVRKKFGDGNLPFEDEVIGVNLSGSMAYIKKVDAVQGDDSIWRRRVDVQTEALKAQSGVNTNIIT